MDSSRRSRTLGFVLVVLTAAGWGIGWTIFKRLLDDWPPLFARGIAGLVGAAGLMSFAALSGRGMRAPRELWAKIGIGAFLNVFVWMGFTALSLRWLNVSEGTLLTYTMPLWATLLAWPLLNERPGARDLAALALGFGGVVVLVLGPQLSAPVHKLPGVGLALVAAVLFAFGAVRARTPMPLDPVITTAWQVALGSSAMVAVSLAFEQPRIDALSAANVGSLLYVASVPMAVCYLAWFAALKRLPTSTAAMGSLLVPVYGTVTAAWWLHEPLSATGYAAFLMVLGGVLLALSKKAR